MAPKKGIPGRLDVDSAGNAYLLGAHGTYQLARLHRIRLEMVGADGIMLSGWEPIRGTDNRARFQQWWLAYPENKK